MGKPKNAPFFFLKGSGMIKAPEEGSFISETGLGVVFVD